MRSAAHVQKDPAALSWRQCTSQPRLPRAMVASPWKEERGTTHAY